MLWILLRVEIGLDDDNSVQKDLEVVCIEFWFVELPNPLISIIYLGVISSEKSVKWASTVWLLIGELMA